MKKLMILVLCLGVFLALSGTDSWGACGGITKSGNVSGNKAGWTQIGTVPKDSRMWVNASGTVDFGCTFCTCVDGPTAGVEGTLQSFKQVFNLLGQALNPLNVLNPVDGFQKSVDAVKNLFGSTQQPNYDQGGVWIKVLKKNGSPYIATQLYYFWAHDGGINKYGLPINEDVNVYAKAHDGGKNPEATNSYGDNHGAYYVTMKTRTKASASSSTHATAPAAPSSYFNVQQGMDLPGKDYYKFTTKGDYAECDSRCSMDQKCLAYTWVKPGVQGADAVCWLKSGVPNTTKNPNCVSGVRKGVSVTGLFNINQGTNRAGQDYKNVSVKGGSDQCERACGSESKCLAFTWVQPGVQGADAVCWLKSGVPNATQNPNCVSGVRKALPAKQVGVKIPLEREASKVDTTIPKQQQAIIGGMEMNTDRPGMDYKNFNLSSPEPKLCESSCQQDTTCKAWTYVKPGVQGQSARCWLKSGVPAPLQNNCCVSGVMSIKTKTLTPITIPTIR